MTSPMPALPPLNNSNSNNNSQAMNDNNELVEATISYMNTMPPLRHNQPPQQLHNTVSPASRHEGQQHYNHRQQQQRTSHHHQYHNQYHPYARPPQSNTPYNQEYGYEGYYQNNTKMSYPMPPRQQQHQVSPHEGSPHPQYQSPMPPYQANNMMQQQRHPPTIITTTKSPSLPSKSSSKSSKSKSKSIKSALASNSKVKKPPRSYTEYNIFFQLERERILGNLIEEQELKKKTGGEDKGDDKEDEKEGVESGKGDEDEKDKDVADDTNNKDNTEEEDGDEEDKPYPTIDSKGRPLNTPSDSNDILPRPPRFAHLQLSPLWYDSTHRLAESKRNKAKRKHRKTHGLVGFLELTKMIAKEWKVVDTITKSYCKRVADRQLVLYKEEMKEVKKKQQLEEQEMMLNVVAGDDNNASGSGKSKSKKQKKDERTPMQLQQMLRIQESTAPKEVVVKYDNKDVGRYPHQEYRDQQGGTVRHSYPPPPPSQYWSPRFVQQQQQVGPPPQFRNEREGPSGYSSQRSIPQGYQQQYGHQGRTSSSSNRQHYSPPSSNLPPLTPDSQFPMNDHHHGVSSSGNGNNNGNLLTPLDELNRRRALYGAQAAAIEAKSKFRSPGTSRLERAMRGQGGGGSTTSVNNRALISGKIQQDKVSSASYLSPADKVDNQQAMSAVTPSPSRRSAGLVIGASPDASSESSSPSASTGTVTDKGAPPSNTVDGSMTPSQLPMKKRRKKLLEENSEVDIDSDIKKNNKDTTSSKPGLPIRHSSVNSIGGFLSSPGFGFQLSPGSMGMMTPGGGNGTFGSPTQYHKALVGPYLNDNIDGGVKSSPFPYIDWSPQESSPQDTKDQQGGKPSLATRDHSRGVVPPHLGVPGGYHHAHGHHPIQYRHPGNMLGPHNGMSPGIGFADEGALDLDEEEMKLMWSKMATTAKRKRVASRDQAAAWMYGGSFAASPGGNMGGMMSWAHSFSSPGNLGGRPDILARGMSNGSVMKKEETISAHAESNGEEKTEAGKKTELPSLTEV